MTILVLKSFVPVKDRIGGQCGTVGQASSLSVGAHGCAPFVDDRQDAGPTQDARRHQIIFFFAITFENPYRRIKREGISKAPGKQELKA